MDAYSAFLAGKRLTVPATGISVTADQLHPALFPFQRDLTRWALLKGRAALFADTGLGKTLMQLEWARHAAERVLILAPLAVAQQTVAEGARWGIPVTYARRQADAAPTGITITNYEMLDHFMPAAFGAVVLDESSILKSFDGVTRHALVAAFAHTPRRLACTATPAPNDVAELGNHAEFLGVMPYQDMLATFFVHQPMRHTSAWRLKGHARQPFYRWLASWAMSLKRPSDLGYSDDGYNLPPLDIRLELVPTEFRRPDQLFATTLHGITDRVAVRKATLNERVAAAVHIVNAESVYFGHEGTEQSGLHASVAREEPRTGARVPGTDEGQAECPSPRVVRSGRTATDSSAGAGEALATGQYRKAEGTEAPPPWGHSSDVPRSAGVAGWAVRDLLLRGHEQPQHVPGGGSLPCDGASTGFALHELQSGARQVAGRPDLATSCDSVSLEEPWIIWCGLNAEQDALARAFGERCVSIDGRTPLEEKLRLLALWCSGQRQVLISKVPVLGFGLNFQRCARMVFVGLGDSYEQYYQAIRRCWRFGQTRSVQATVVLTEPEEAIYQNVLRKEHDAATTAHELIRHVAEFERGEIQQARAPDPYEPHAPLRVPPWLRSAPVPLYQEQEQGA
jgi:superfamily II DNA or RNA helicase